MSSSPVVAPVGSVLHGVRQYHALTKPRVIQLIVFCALIGMVLAVPGWPTLVQVRHAAIACFGIWLVAGAAAAFNCVVERHIDARMKRTAWRPTAKGELPTGWVLAFSALLCAGGSAVLYVWTNPLTMWLTLATFVGNDDLQALFGDGGCGFLLARTQEVENIHSRPPNRRCRKPCFFTSRKRCGTSLPSRRSTASL